LGAICENGRQWNLRVNLPYLFDPAVGEVAFQNFYEQPFLWPTLYRLTMSGKPEETSASFGGPGYFQPKVEGAAMSTDRLTQQFVKTFTHTPYSLVLEVSREARDDDRFGIIDNIGSTLGQKGAETMEYYGALLFNGITTTTNYTAEDGLAIVSSAHVNGDGGNSQSNTTTGPLNYANAKLLREDMRKVTGYEADQKMSIIPDEIMGGVDIEEDGWQIVRTSGKPGTANNDMNFFSSGYTFYVWPWLDWTVQWVMMASNIRRNNLRWYQRVGLEIMGDATFSQGTRKIGGYERFVNGCVDWRWVRYSTGA